MTHDYHDALPGYSPDQIWHDGCAECESRGETLAIYTLDTHNFARAWNRALEWRDTGLGNMARAERKLLGVLESIQIQLEKHGVDIPSLF